MRLHKHINYYTMKKIYLTLAASIFAVGLFAQAPVNNTRTATSKHTNTNDKPVTKTLKDFIPSATSSSRATTISENVSALGLLTDFYGTSTTQYLGYTNPIFPDSNVMIAYTSSTSPAWLHSVAQTFHLTGLYATSPGKVFDPMTQPFSANTPFSIDSIQIQGYYNRLDNSVVDTAIVSVYADDNGNYTRGIWISNPDSTKLIIDYRTKTKTAGDSAVATYKIVLDNAFFNDTLSNGAHLFQVASNLTVNGNHNGVFGVSIAFKPGKTSYSQATDTLFANSNSIRVVYSTPLGQNASFPIGAGRDYNIGSFNDDNSLYGTWSYFLPPFVFTTDHVYQMYDINVKVSQTNSDNASVKELANNAKLFQNFPNPTSGFTTVRYSLENQSQVTFEMMDVTGKI